MKLTVQIEYNLHKARLFELKYGKFKFNSLNRYET